jgi:MFS family permease
MQNVGAAWLMTSITADPFVVALVQVASNAPFFVLAIPAGALADVTDRRRLAMGALGFLAISAALLAGLSITGRVGPGALLALTFAVGVGSALLAPALTSIVPELVPRHEISHAVSLNGISMNLARAAGPALGGLVVAAAGAGTTFALNAASFLAVLVVLKRWRRPRLAGRLPPEDLVGAMRAGARYVRRSASLRRVLVRTGAFVLPASAVWALLPLYSRNELALGPSGFGLLLGFFGLGAVGAGVSLPTLRSALGVEGLLRAATLVFAASHLLLAATEALFAAGLALTAAGAAWLSVLSTLSAAAQVAIPAWVRARALGTHLLVLSGSLAAGSALWGAAASAVGVPASFAVAGITIALAQAAAWRLPLSDESDRDLEPAAHWPEPPVGLRLESDRGPALVTVEYDVDPARAAGFVSVMQELRTTRLRDGAIRWGLWADVARPGRYLESFVVESWLEHLRQHERVTGEDRDLQMRVWAFQRGLSPPEVRHFIHERPDPSH